MAIGELTRRGRGRMRTLASAGMASGTRTSRVVRSKRSMASGLAAIGAGALLLSLMQPAGAASVPVTARMADRAGSAEAPERVQPPNGKAADAADATFTLLTGDVVRLITSPDEAQSGEVVHDAGRQGDVTFKQIDDDLYALPGVAMRQVADGRLDMELFNLTKLAEYGYDDASVDTLPVIATHPPRLATGRRALPTPAGAHRTERLDSIDAQALAVDKERTEVAWETLGDPDGDVEKVWLDAKVEATLDESVPAVGAPTAWDAGFDGTGTKIAVLDTGIDLTHPDVGAVDELTYEITDANGDTTTATVQIAVTPNVDPPDTPAATDDTAVTRVENPVTIPVLDNDTGQNLQIASDDIGFVLGDPEHGSVTVNDDHTVTYTPDDGYTGDDPFQYAMTDDSGEFTRWSQIGTVNVTVGPAEGPIAVDDLVTTHPDTPVTIAGLDNDAGDSIQLSGINEGPENGTATVDGSTITYSPNDGFRSPVTAAESFIPGEAVRDRRGHGTHVAATAAGSGAASDGQYRGVAPGADLLVGKVLDDSGNGTVSSVIEGMEWAADHGADVVNMSLGGAPDDGSHPLSEAVDRLSEETDTLFVIAAGNLGRGESSTVTWPGTADRALTVGAGEWHEAWDFEGWRRANFSSVGPRRGDHAIKPEIIAPGVGIVAARAAWTFMGAPVGGSFADAAYIAAGGTSMATPHVAGGAAILAQQHPGWTGQQIKDALISTADPAYESINGGPGRVHWQGGGMLDVAGAVGSPLLATGTLHLGRVQAPHPDSVSGELTLQNVSDQPVHADMSVHLRKSTGNFGQIDLPYTPAAGEVTVSPSTVEVPAGGTATVTVTVQLESLPTPSSYFGWLQARVDDEVLARTTVGWTKDHELHRLSIRATDRGGAPAHTNGVSFITIVNLDGHLPIGGETSAGGNLFGYWVEGRAYVPGLGFDPMLPEGRYMLSGNISDWTAQTPASRLSETVIVDPEIVLDENRSISFDARDANRVEFNPPDRDAVENPTTNWDLWINRTWEINGETRSYGNSVVAPAVYTFPASPVDHGTLTFSVDKEYIAEDLTMTAFGAPGLPELHPAYPPDTNCGRPHPGCSLAFTSARPLVVVDGGHGTPEELAAADVAGKLVLVIEEPRDINFPEQWYREFGAVASAAEDAGAAGVLYGVSDPGPPLRWFRTNPVDIPVAVLTHAEADQMAAALQGPRKVRIRTGGEPVSPYSYQLAMTLDHVPADTAFELAKDDLATVETHYHADRPDTPLFVGTASTGVGQFQDPGPAFTAPTTRTEYVIGGQPTQVRLETVGRDDYRRAVTVREYEAGAEVVERVMSPPAALGIGAGPALAATWSRNLILAPRIRAGRWQYDRIDIGGQSAARVMRDGQVLCEDPSPRRVVCQVEEPGRYRIEVESADQASPAPTSSRTSWEVDVDFPATGDPNVNLPMVDVHHDVGVSMANTVRAGSRYPITLSPGYQPGYDGASTFSLSAWVSHDDGQTWTELGTEQVAEDGQVEFTARTPKDAEHTSLRVVAEDENGNSIDQTLINAWDVTSVRQ